MILKGRKEIGEKYGIAKRTVSYWLSEYGIEHTRERDENGNMVPVVDTDSVEKRLIERETDKLKDRFALAGRGG